MTRLGILIPAYNAEATLAGVVARIPADPGGLLHRIWIVDDGSTDGTSRIAAALAAGRPQVEVITLSRNRGYGAAVKRGLAACKAADVDAAACVHADGQYAPEELPALLAALSARGLDLLQGSRIAPGTALSGGMPLYKFVANRALTTLENLIFRMRMTDYHSGYMVYGRRALEQLPFYRLSDSFDFDLEVIASARAAGLALGEHPIPTHYGDEISHLRSIPYGLRVLGVMFNYLAGRYHRPDFRNE
jgi:glycosyltransferase involved in cell wall biosynthesis